MSVKDEISKFLEENANLVETTNIRDMLKYCRNKFGNSNGRAIYEIVKKKYEKKVPVDIEREFELLNPINNVQKNPKILEDHLKETNGAVITRFPPEPNGYLHIGHAKAIYINFSYANRKGGKCYLRLDDTNPQKEKVEYIESIIEDVRWLGYKPYKITYSSDYFDILYKFAKDLIKRDKAYVCELSQEQMREDRRNKIESPYRNRSIEQSLYLFKGMKKGKYDEGSMVLRMKGDMQSDNPNMRDHVAYRIIYREHPKVGDKWCIYPSYDYTHCIVDSLENITHSLCSMEFQTRNESYKWLLDALDMYRPPQIEYSRLNISHTVLSKRKLKQLIDKKIVDKWDDPRLPTIKGMRRRGYTPNAINKFCKKIGLNIGGSGSITNYEQLEECVREDLNIVAKRLMAVKDPLKVNIMNCENDITVNALHYPYKKENSPIYRVKFGKVIYIDRNDFRVDYNKDYKRLALNRIVRLKYAYPIKCIGYKLDKSGGIEEIYAKYIEDNSIKVSSTITWISEKSVKVEIRSYDRMFPKICDHNWIKNINTRSKNAYFMWTDKLILNAKHYDKFQFERIGYFSVDIDSNQNNFILNEVVPIKESKAKKIIG